MTGAGYTSDTSEIVQASWSKVVHDCVAAFKLSESSPLPPHQQNVKWFGSHNSTTQQF
jgi:hypothetical protein